jgi:hypothetical protein
VPNPIDKLKAVATEAVQHPRRTAENVVGGAVEIARGTVQKGLEVAGTVTSRVTGGRETARSAPDRVTEPDDASTPVMRAPAKKAPPPKKAAAKKAAPAKKTAKKAAKKAPAKKAAATKAAPPPPPPPASDVGEGPDVETPVGTTGAGEAFNPDTAETDLQQPGTEPLVDPSTTKAVASEAETLGQAADPDKE